MARLNGDRGWVHTRGTNNRRCDIEMTSSRIHLHFYKARSDDGLSISNHCSGLGRDCLRQLTVLAHG